MVTIAQCPGISDLTVVTSGEHGVLVHRRGRAEIARVGGVNQAGSLGRSDFSRHHSMALNTLSLHLRKQLHEEKNRGIDGFVQRSPVGV